MLGYRKCIFIICGRRGYRKRFFFPFTGTDTLKDFFFPPFIAVFHLRLLQGMLLKKKKKYLCYDIVTSFQSCAYDSERRYFEKSFLYLSYVLYPIIQ